MLVIIKDWGVFQDKTRNGMGKARVQFYRKTWFSLCFTTLVNVGTFQDNNLKNKAKSTLQLLSKKTVNVPEWLSYSLDLNLVENLWQDLRMIA
jgi:hypothetical protein